MPALLDHQDPEDLAARVAFHLHRLNISTTALRAAGQLTRAAARQMREGQLLLFPSDTRWLCAALEVEDGELTRPLTDEEQRDWQFYRTSVRHPAAVWARVGSAIAARGLSHAGTADIMGIQAPRVSASLNGAPRGLILQRPPAARLARHLELPLGPDTFIADLPRYPLARER
jgi:hypothetical protein